MTLPTGATFSRVELLSARRQLPAMLHQARELIKTDPSYRMKPTSRIGESMFSRLSEANIDALVVYQGPLGGWYADVVFKGLPVGSPNVIGTPVGEPNRTRQEAMKQGIDLLACLLSAEPTGPKASVFEFHTVDIVLDQEALEFITLHPQRPKGDFDKYVLRRLEEVTEDLFPHGVSVEAVRALSERDRGCLMAVVYIASGEGIFRYPVPEHAPLPTEH